MVARIMLIRLVLDQCKTVQSYVFVYCDHLLILRMLVTFRWLWGVSSKTLHYVLIYLCHCFFSNDQKTTLPRNHFTCNEVAEM